MENRNLITSIVLFAIAAVFLWQTAQLPVGSPSLPEAGFFPLILVILLAFLALVLLWQSRKAGEGEKKIPFWMDAGGRRLLVLSVAGLFAFVIFFEYVGYLIATFLLVALPLWASDRVRWWTAVIGAFLSVLASYIVFTVLLQSALPLGILKGILGE